MMRTEFETNRIRKRRQHLTPRVTLDVTWNFTYDQFETFKVFFDVDLVNGSGNFVIDLFGESREVEFVGPYSFSHTDNLYAVSATLFLAPILSIPYDDFELYLDGANLHGRAGGVEWSAEFVWEGRANQFGVQAYDTFFYYDDDIDLNALNGLNKGIHFYDAYVARVGFVGIQCYDTFEEYSDGGLEGLTGGTRWFPEPYVTRIAPFGVKREDSMDTYLDGSTLNGLNGGTSQSDVGAWSPYVDR